MSGPRIIIEGLDSIRDRFGQFPGKFSRALHRTMEAVLLKIWELIPGYPPPPPDSTYTRTGTLGRTLGGGMSGGREGKPDIYYVRKSHGYQEASFGTRLKYAPYVIGEKQAKIHQGRWWRLPVEVLNSAIKPIERLFQSLAEELVKWLDGKGL